MSEQPDPSFDAREYAREYARDMVRTGFETKAFIVQSVTACMEEYELDHLDQLVQASVDTEISLLIEEQQAWDRPTDCERLDRVFDELKANGILAQHHYTCCGTCGNFEIELHLKYELAQGRSWRGYAFYHVQDTESAVKGYGQCLSYGSANFDEEASVRIGQEIVQVLRSHGFEPNWNGTIEKRISFDMNWQQPWPPRAPDVVPQGALDMCEASQTPREKKKRGFVSSLRGLFKGNGAS